MDPEGTPEAASVVQGWPVSAADPRLGEGQGGRRWGRARVAGGGGEGWRR